MNLNLRVELLDGAGNTVAVPDPTNTLDARVNLTVPTSGVYYAAIEGVGQGDPLITGFSDYGRPNSK